jgi:transposase
MRSVETLRRLARREVGRVSERIYVVLLAARGYPVGKIAEIFERDEQTGMRWLERFHAAGVEGLRDCPRSGRPRLPARKSSAWSRRG